MRDDGRRHEPRHAELIRHTGAHTAKAHLRRGQLSARRVRDRVPYGFRKIRLPAGERPTYTEAHLRYGDCIVGTTKHVAAIVDGALR